MYKRVLLQSRNLLTHELEEAGQVDIRTTQDYSDILAARCVLCHCTQVSNFCEIVATMRYTPSCHAGGRRLPDMYVDGDHPYGRVTN
jgi:hypothetical protein